MTVQNLGAQWSRKPPRKPNDVAGDGTTTATVLAEAIFREGLKMISAGADPMALSRGINKATTALVEAIKKLATPINEKNRTEIKQIANVGQPARRGHSAAQSNKIGKNGKIVAVFRDGDEASLNPGVRRSVLPMQIGYPCSL